jgi:hypothetical protein
VRAERERERRLYCANSGIEAERWWERVFGCVVVDDFKSNVGGFGYFGRDVKDDGSKW